MKVQITSSIWGFQLTCAYARPLPPAYVHGDFDRATAHQLPSQTHLPPGSAHRAQQRFAPAARGRESTWALRPRQSAVVDREASPPGVARWRRASPAAVQSAPPGCAVPEEDWRSPSSLQVQQAPPRVVCSAVVRWPGGNRWPATQPLAPRQQPPATPGVADRPGSRCQRGGLGHCWRRRRAWLQGMGGGGAGTGEPPEVILPARGRRTGRYQLHG